MIAKLSLLFTVVTIVELSLLIPLGQALGLPATVALVIGTAILGASLAKRQGSAVWNDIQEELRNGGLPKDALLDGIGVLIAGAFLLTPGVLTDVAGIGLLIPWVRTPIKALVKDRLKEKIKSSSVSYIEQRRDSVDAYYDRPSSSEVETEAEVIDVSTGDAEDGNDGPDTERDPTTDQMTAGV